MEKRLYVTNISFKATENEVRAHFVNYGSVMEVKFLMDREDEKKFRGIAFIEMGHGGFLLR